MPAELAPRIHPHALPAIVLVAALLITWLAYAPGMGGSLHFDDRANLQGLATVHDSNSAFQFAISGYSGPLGRPLALASFLPEAHAWPNTPEVFLRTNILIHLLNGALVTWFLYLVGCARRQPERQAALIAVASSAIWMLMPILASSSLMIVQRMTTLSAVFALLGAITYLYARTTVDRHPKIALLGMTVALGAGAILAALAKETGALLFLFIFAVEATLLKRPSNISQRVWRIWFGVTLLTPLAALLIYLGSVVPYSDGLVLRRGFSGFERLITQAEILWKYLYISFLPNVQNLGPFHDDYPVQQSLLNVAAILSLGAWFVVIAAAIMLRKRAPLFSFALAWYLFGHLLESTTLNLELYFEHRNYLPLVGPVYALIASLKHIEQKWRRVAGIGTVVYAGILGSVLYSLTSLWGSPTVAAEMWHVYNPASIRATYHLADRLKRENYSFASRRLLTQYVDENPGAYGVELEVLVISCELEPEADHGEAIQSLADRLPATRFSPIAALAFQRLFGLVRENRCPSIDYPELYLLGQSLLENPGFNVPTVRHNIHVILARMGMDRGDFDSAVTHIMEALTVDPNPDTLWLAIGIFYSGGRRDIAWELFTEAKNRDRPRNPFYALQWDQELSRMQEFLVSTE